MQEEVLYIDILILIYYLSPLSRLSLAIIISIYHIRARNLYLKLLKRIIQVYDI